ncbi:MAG: serpin family protein [Lachnospiraceae bacterium]|nr:serpin family protein [Lachnospiraceae bacterium]
MKKRIVAGLLAIMMLAGCGAGSTGNTGNGNGTRSREYSSTNVCENVEPVEINVESGDIEEEWINSLSASSMNLLEAIMEEQGEGNNIMISPTSMMMAFGMLENGASGETLSEIENVIGGGVKVGQMNPLMYSIADRFESSKDVRWNVANSVWLRDNGRFEIVPEFAQAARSYYNADIWMAAFDENTVNDINSWADEQTYGMIKEIIQGIEPETYMYLINAVAFEGEWMNEYEETQIVENYDFHNYNGTVSQVTMLSSVEDKYIELGNGVGFVRPYKGGEYSFVGILPEEGTSVEEYIASLAESGTDFAEAFRNAKGYDADIIVKFPEFKNEYEVEMADILKGMGMETAFNPEYADFTGLIRPTEGSDFPAYIGGVFHKTFIEVNREGTRAAAVTAIELDCAGCEPMFVPPMIITLDRPFVYAVVDNETGLPVFLGTVNSL